jgi:chemotaxis protein MotB
MARKKKEECKSIPGWLVSFSDLMSLLLTFFILLYAMSTVDVSKAMKFLSYFQGENPKFVAERIAVLPPIVPFTTDVILKVKKRIKKILPVWAYQIAATKEYALIRLFDDVIFLPDSYILTPKAKKALKGIAKTLKAMEKELKTKGVKIKIVGHTDITTPSKKMPFIKDSWDLSLKRATTVADFLIRNKIDPSLVAVAGYGNTKPLYKWHHPMLKRRNSRVEIFLMVQNNRVNRE